LESGIKVEGEVRDATTLQVGGSKQLVIGRNNAGVLLFQRTKK
jgi:hypothetical protein